MAVLVESDSDSEDVLAEEGCAAELPDGLDKASIHSIVDHHKLCGLKTSAPLEMDVRAL